MSKPTPESRIRAVVDACTDCDSCRYFMLSSCLFFEELFFLVDRERSHHGSITDGELRRLADRCNLCALCPCPNIRAGIIEAKTLYGELDGLNLGVRNVFPIESHGRLATQMFLPGFPLSQETFDSFLVASGPESVIEGQFNI